jgi:hypothetical protein
MITFKQFLLLEDVWSEPQQEITSAATSINAKSPAAAFKLVDWSGKEGTINADIGGGKYDNAAEYLKQFGIENIVYDPFNRSFQHNQEAIKRIRDGQSNTATVFNVLNVIKEPEIRDLKIRQAANAVGKNGTAYFYVYEDPKKQAGLTSKGWQEFRKIDTYIPEIHKHFSNVTKRNRVIVATN